MPFIVDRVDVFGNIREHISDDGLRTLCGQDLTSANARMPSGGLSCIRCRRRQARADAPVFLRPTAHEIESTLETLARSLVRITADEPRGERIRRLVPREHDERLAELSALQQEARDIGSLRLIAMTVEVLRGNRNLAQFTSLCEELVERAVTSDSRRP